MVFDCNLRQGRSSSTFVGRRSSCSNASVYPSLRLAQIIRYADYGSSFDEMRHMTPAQDFALPVSPLLPAFDLHYAGIPTRP